MQCANAVLLLGARPIMAEHPEEVREITASAKALLLNFGNVTRDRLEAMAISYDEAMKKEIPVVIDAVGAACSELRRSIVRNMTGIESAESEENMHKEDPDKEKFCVCEREDPDKENFCAGKRENADKEYFCACKREDSGKDRLYIRKRNSKVPMLLKGNYSEIYALYDAGYRASGVDADKKLTFEDTIGVAQKLAKSHNLIVLASGKKDIVTDGNRTAVVENGTKKLAGITGTGCMLGAVCAGFFAIDTDIESVVCATAAFGISGEKADGDIFLMRLFDAISEIDDEIIKERKRVTWY